MSYNVKAQIMEAVIKTVAECGEHGIPSGPVYSFLMNKMSLIEYESMIMALVESKAIVKSGNILRIGERGILVVEKLKAGVI